MNYWCSAPRSQQLVFLHGSSAHAMWWGWTVPLLTEHFQCLVLDSGGHGDSDWLTDYEPRRWVDEIDAVCEEASAAAPYLVGHSRGGRLGVLAAGRRESAARGLVLLDVGIRPPEQHRPAAAPSRPTQRRYESLERARAAFRLLPPEPGPAAAVMDDVAAYSIRQVGEDWCWQHDARVPINIDDDLVEAAMRLVQVPVTVMYGEHSAVVAADVITHVQRHLPVVAVRRLAGAAHHLVLTHPGEVAQFVRWSVDRFTAP